MEKKILYGISALLVLALLGFSLQTLGPDGEHLYVSTSNTDGRGTPGKNDDRILKIDSRAIPK